MEQPQETPKMYYYVFQIGNDEECDAIYFEESKLTYDDIIKEIIRQDTMYEVEVPLEIGHTISVSLLDRFDSEDYANGYISGKWETLEEFACKAYKHYDIFLYEGTPQLDELYSKKK